MVFGMTYFQICLYFLVYSFGGWVVEVIFHAVALGKVINRGFLNGPVCPVYGFGVLSVFAMLNTIQSGGHQMNDAMIFLFGIILATAVELQFPRIYLSGVFADLGTCNRYGSKGFSEICRKSGIPYPGNLGVDRNSCFICSVSDRLHCDGSSYPWS